MSTNLERMLKAAGHKVPETKPTLEVNPHHPLVLLLPAEDRVPLQTLRVEERLQEERRPQGDGSGLRLGPRSDGLAIRRCHGCLLIGR